MKWMYAIKYKIKAVAGLVLILSLILIGNLVTREKFAKLDKSMHSIYNDRLKPSVYIFEITNIIYQKRLLLKDDLPLSETTARIKEYDRTIAGLIHSYEGTFLTTAEKKQWQEFKLHLERYNALESQFVRTDIAYQSNKLTSDAEFSSVLHDLSELSKIQIGEGDILQKRSESMINSSIAFSTFEMALLVILGLFTMAILGISDHVIFNKTHQHHLN